MLTLHEILAANEQRVLRQNEFRQKYNATVVSITINIPGEMKDSPVIRRLCDFAVAQVNKCLTIIAYERINTAVGPEAILAVGKSADEVKKIAISIEEQWSFGRLLDIDVIAANGGHKDRADFKTGLRNCLLCEQPAVICMREKRHSLDDLRAAVGVLTDKFLAFETRNIGQAAESIGSIAVEAMLFEVSATPAPGLVDRVNSGAHQDMDFYSFMASSAALATTMARCAQAGLRHEGKLSSLLPVLRHIGLEGEGRMRAATGGVNTHKGLLFSLGIVAAAVGWLVKQRDGRIETLFSTVALITEGIVERELGGINQATDSFSAGERLYIKCGTTGIRGEMEKGLPSVKDRALPCLRKALSQGLPLNEALVQTLLALMECVDDTTVMNRHNPDILINWLRPRVAEVLAAGGSYTQQGLRRVALFDKECITHNISPGGAADLLAITWFAHRTEELVKAGISINKLDLL